MRPPLIALLTLILLGGGTSRAADATVPDFQKEIAPLLKSRCVACHGPAKQEAKLNLALPPGIKRGGEHGPVIVNGDPQQSLLWKRVSAGEMPVDKPLPADEQALLQRWIAAGAPGLPAEVALEARGDEHWAFQPLTRVVVPRVADPSAMQRTVDYFLAAKLESAGLKFSPEANRETLIRRVCFDLTGLPPTLFEIDRFLADPRPDAYEQMVERFLSSKHYGERWGKYWLDAAGYADSNGYFGADTDRPLAYRYRDYVIRSINADKPWDQFIREQVAGDELAGYQRGGDVRPDMVELLEAAHFLRNSPDGTDSSDGNPDEVRADKYAVLEGTQQIIGSSLLGLTVQCARCHDHKFEPFSQQDYYRLQAVIYPAFNIEQWILPRDREIQIATATERAIWNARSEEINKDIAELRQEFSEWAQLFRVKGREIFVDSFDPERPLADLWNHTVPGDTAPSGTPPIQLDVKTAPAANALRGTLQIIESGTAGDRVLSTRQTFDWTPNHIGGWIQATFDLVAGGDTAPYIGYLIALRDFNDAEPRQGGNVLLDGAAAGQAAVHVDYPGPDSQTRGKVGQSGYVPGRNYGVRVTSLGEGKYGVRQVVDGIPENGSVVLTEADLPDGAFGFEYCCGRSFVVDNLLIEEGLPDAELSAAERALIKQQREKKKELDAAIKELERHRPKPPGLLAVVCDRDGQPPTVRMLNRGEYKSPGDEVTAGAPQVLSETANPSEFSRDQNPPVSSTGQRLAFARWLTQPNSRAASRLARVTVNRWWQNHFGTGIVATADNLGYSGAAPTHPELLDYLAGELIRQNWSAKAIHRSILNSAAYRQSSLPTVENERLDPDGRLLSRFPLRRLDAEAIRDAMLRSSGELDRQMFGPYSPVKSTDDGDVVVAEPVTGGQRRSIYLQQRRTQVVGMLEVFDAPSIVFNCTSRATTTVPLQSLKLLNSNFVRARATGLAKRARPTASVTDDVAFLMAFRVAWGRAPTTDELASARRFLIEQTEEYTGQPHAVDAAWIDFCQMLLASNAFLYVE